MHLKSIAYLFGIISFSMNAQELTLSGKVIDIKNMPIVYANVVLLMDEDSILVNGTSTDEDGFFKVDNLKEGSYQLKITYLGYKTYIQNITLNSNTDSISVILEESTEALNDVLIVTKRPTVKRLIDRVVFDVENTTLSNSNVLDVLKYSPGVFVNEGVITVKNSEPIIYINDRKIHLSSTEVQQLLEGTSASNIKSIEIITNPPAKYEAEGAAVINIVTSKNIVSGYHGSVFGNYKQGFEFPKYSVGTSHFFKTEKFNTYINYNVSPRKDFRHNDEFVNFYHGNNIDNRWESEYNRIRKSSDHNLNANLDYNFNEFNSLGFSSNILISPRKNTKINTNSITNVIGSGNLLDSLFNTNKLSVGEVHNFAFTLDYIHKFKRVGEKISISAHHTNYDYSDFQNVETGYFYPNTETSFRNNKFQTFSHQYIKLNTGQIDYEFPLNDSSKLEAGAKVSSIDSESILNQYNFENDESVKDTQNSDTFLYDEVNYSVYVSYSKDWEKWSLQTGLRTEHTNIFGFSLLNNELNKSNYIKPFPSINILHHLNDNNSIYFNYKKRVYRPRYNELNPFRYYYNDNTYSMGNPNLKPQIDDVITLGYTFNKDYTLELYYRYEDSPTMEIVYQDNQNNIIKYVNTNIDYSISYGIDFTTYTKITPRWSLYGLTSIFYYDNKFVALESNNKLVSNDRWSLYAQINNYFIFLKDESLSLDVSYNYISPIAEGSMIISERSGLNLNLKKTLWDNKASIIIGIEDIFNTQNFYTSTKYLNQNVQFISKMENRLFLFGFDYKFGNTRLKTYQRKINMEELDRLDKKTDN